MCLITAKAGGLDRRHSFATDPAAIQAEIQLKEHNAATAQLDELNKREREIFEELLRMGVKEDDPDLNEVHKALLQWYRLDLEQQEIELQLENLT